MPALSPINTNNKLTIAAQDQLKELVWQVLKSAVKENRFIMPDAPILAELLKPKANFVTLYVDEKLKGCIGICAAEEPLWSSVCQHSYNSAMKDWRFSALCEDEFTRLSFCISVLSELTPIDNQGEESLLNELVIGIDGLILKEKAKTAVFLPLVWRSLKTPKLFLAALKKKGEWPMNYWSQDIKLDQFTTVEYFS